MKAVTMFGELITTEIKKNAAGDIKFLVYKRVDGKLHSMYPANSMGKAKLISANLIQSI